MFPFSVYINRGNHEDILVNKRYGFEKEVLNLHIPLPASLLPLQVIAKYGKDADTLFPAFSLIFTLLPLGTIIDETVLVVHAVWEPTHASFNLKMPLAGCQRHA